jgi:hypothetical protein
VNKLPVPEITNTIPIMTQKSAVFCPRKFLLKNVVRAVKCWYCQRIQLMIHSEPSRRDVKTLSYRPWSLKGRDQSRISLLQSNHSVYSNRNRICPSEQGKTNAQGEWVISARLIRVLTKEILGTSITDFSFLIVSYRISVWAQSTILYWLHEAESFLISWQVFS